jgi:DNA-binding NarL/FixJ family response regulator
MHGLTVIVADDHTVVREGIAALCAAKGMRVLGQAADGGAAIDMIQSKQPDFAILDLRMPVATGVEVTHRLKSENCKTKILILSMSREEDAVVEALLAGAGAYLPKDGSPQHLLDAVNSIRDGGIYVSPLLVGHVYFVHEPPKPPDFN